MLRVRLCLKPRVGAQNVEFLFVPCRVRDSVFHTPVTGNELFRNISPEDDHYLDAQPRMNTNVNEGGGNLPESLEQASSHYHLPLKFG